MNKLQKQRFYGVVFLFSCLALATGLILFALKRNINVFFTPSQLIDHPVSSSATFRLGGMVKKNSVKHEASGIGVTFIVTDFKHELSVRYQGILPDLFREGKGVVVEGKLISATQVKASQVLAKHDENYMPQKMYLSIKT
jgi:cytochrome c-type biogenesis protein CcmE